MTYETNWLQWPFVRRSRDFRIYVVEPETYTPSGHSRVFDAVLRNFFASPQSLAGTEESFDAPDCVEADLIVFPEAFLPASDLLSAMESFREKQISCCIHVGLRPDGDDSQHLFDRAAINSLLKDIKKISDDTLGDLASFSNWLGQQKGHNFYNLACIFLVDSDSNLRVCLHPKSIRSADEYQCLPECNMTEGRLLSLVTLVPTENIHMSITIQPLICADVLPLPSDSMQANPIEIFRDSSAAKFKRLPTDHVDIVSVVLCTPVDNSRMSYSSKRKWRHEFEAAFINASRSDRCFRHHFSIFAMANFRNIKNKSGGLSGTYLPTPLIRDPHVRGISVWSNGKYGPAADSSWKLLPEEDTTQPPESKRLCEASRAHLVCLDEPNTNEPLLAKALGFTLSRLIRDNPIGANHPGLTSLDVRYIPCLE